MSTAPARFRRQRHRAGFAVFALLQRVVLTTAVVVGVLVGMPESGQGWGDGSGEDGRNAGDGRDWRGAGDDQDWRGAGDDRDWRGAGDDRPMVRVADTAPARWIWPVPPPRVVSRGFKAPETEFGSGHRGIDVIATPGAPVTAPASGVVHFAGVVVDRPIVSVRVGLDTIVSIEPVIPAVREGELVVTGQVLGEVTSAGHCSVGCVHVGVRVHGQYVSPLAFLSDLRPSVLLPTRKIG